MHTCCRFCCSALTFKCRRITLFMLVIAIAMLLYFLARKDNMVIQEEVPDNKICLPQAKVYKLFKNIGPLLDELLELQVSLNEEEQGFLQEKYDIIQNFHATIMSLIAPPLNENAENLLPNTLRQNKKDSPTYSCSEKFKGSAFGYPFYRTGYVFGNCSKLPIKESVSVFVAGIAQAVDIFDMAKIFESNYEGISLYFLVDEETFLDTTVNYLLREFNNVRLYSVGNSSETVSSAVMAVIDMITTPFILFSRSAFTLDDGLGLERMLRVLTEQRRDDVIAVGSSVKDRELGHWSNGCLQLTLNMYTLRFQDGYRKSFNECMICDFLTGPFLIKRTHLQDFPFKADIGDGFFEDWFLNFKVGLGRRKRYLLASCPDVMFVVKNRGVYSNELDKFADLWNIKRIIDENNRIYWFGCRRGRPVRRNQKCSIRAGMAVPPCCLRNLSDAIKFIMAVCLRVNATCELQEGTLLGAVKMKNVLPWERDGDITFLSEDYGKIEKLKDLFASREIQLVPKGKEALKLIRDMVKIHRLQRYYFQMPSKEPPSLWFSKDQ